MAKADIKLVELVLKRAKLDSIQVAKIIEDIKFEVEISKEETTEPPVKKQYVFVVSDPYGKIESLGCDFAGWVFQISDDKSPQNVIAQITNATSDFNITPKGRKMPVKTIDEAVRFVPQKILKESGVWAKHKEPVLVIPHSGRIPFPTHEDFE